MAYGRRFSLVVLGLVLCLQPVLGAEGKLDEQQKEKLLEKSKELRAQAEKLVQAGQYAQALPLCQKEVAVRKETLGAKHPDVADALNYLGQVNALMGLNDKAELLYQEALTIRMEVLGPRNTAVASSLHSLALLYTNMGLFSKAEPLFQQSLVLRTEALGPKHAEVARSLSSLASMYRRMGLSGRAVPQARQALAIRKEVLGPRHAEVAQSLNNLAGLYLDLDLYGQAEESQKEALEIFREVHGSNHPFVALSMNNLAGIYRHMGRYEQAEPLLREGLALQTKLMGPKHPLVTLSLHSLAVLYMEMGRFAKAQPLEQQALTIRKDILGSRHPDVALSMAYLAWIQLAEGQLQTALPLLQQSFAISESLLRTALTESRVIALLDDNRDSADVIYSVLAQRLEDPAVQHLAFSVALLRKGRSTEEGTQTQHAIQQSLKTSEDRALFKRLLNDRSQLANLYLKDPSSVPNYQKTVELLESEADALEQNLAQRSASFRTLQFPGPDEVLARVVKALPQDAALVEWLTFRPRNLSAKGKEPRWGSLRYLALVLFPDQHIRVVHLGEARPIDDAIEALQDQLSQRRPEFLPAAQKLHRLIIAPLQQALEGRTNLFVSPDGALNLVPLWALHDGKQFMVDSYRLTYLTSGRDLLRPPAVAPQALSIAVLADPDFRLASAQGAPAVAQAAVSRAAFFQQLQHVQPLPGTKTEALAIQKLFPQARLLMGRDASERALRSLQAPTVLHIATHGVFWDDRSMPLYEPARTLKIVAGPPTAAVPAKDKPAPVNPLARSALLLAGVEALGQQTQPPPDDNDGLMTALEVSGLNLWGTQLVVLSACDTGRGAVQIGQGVYGLRRAFFNAGAETLVTSLWQVSDQATQELMGSYYRNLLAGQGRVEAMRQAALAVRVKHPHPYYWAPFIVLGNGGPLRGLPVRR